MVNGKVAEELAVPNATIIASVTAEYSITTETFENFFKVIPSGDIKVQFGASAGPVWAVVQLFGGDADDYLALAEAYDDMELFDLSADSWFRYLDVCEEDERVEAYEGLYHCYYHLGNDMMQAFYYKMLKEERERLGEISEDAEYFMDEEEPPAEDKRGKRFSDYHQFNFRLG